MDEVFVGSEGGSEGFVTNRDCVSTRVICVVVVPPSKMVPGQSSSRHGIVRCIMIDSASLNITHLLVVGENGDGVCVRSKSGGECSVRIAHRIGSVGVLVAVSPLHEVVSVMSCSGDRHLRVIVVQPGSCYGTHYFIG